MAFAEDNTVWGQFTSTGVPVTLDCGFQPSYFKLWNTTNTNSTANPGVVKEAWFLPSDTAASAYLLKNTAGAATDETTHVTSGGFTLYNGVGEQMGATQTGTALSKANPGVIASVAHGLSTGDVVKIWSTTLMLQVAAMVYVVTKVDADHFSIPVNTSAFADAATAVSFARLNVPFGWTPARLSITGITLANPGVVTTSTNHGLVTGDVVRIRISSGWGMTQMPTTNLTVTSITANTFSIGIDTSAFTAFAYPTSAVAAGGTVFPEVVPVGDAALQSTSGAENNTAIQGISLGTTVCGANADVIKWMAQRSAITNL